MGLFLFCLGIRIVEAEPLGAVVLQSQGDQVTINRGAEDGVVVGQTWRLSGNAVMIIEAVREHSASGRVEGKASPGMIASLGKEPLRDVMARKADVQKKALAKHQPTQASLDQAQKRYRKALADATKSKSFVTPIPGQSTATMNTGLEAYNLYQLYDITNEIGLDPTGAYLRNPLILATAAAGMYQRQKQVNDLYESARVRVDVEATLWDDKLVDLQTEATAALQGWSVQDTLTKKVQNISDKGVDKYVVLEVRVKNVGTTPAALAPFKYRIFLMSAEDQPIAASRLDSVLDTTLQPGDEIRGMVYFPKIVAVGQRELRIALEQMFGDRGTLKFSGPSH